MELNLLYNFNKKRRCDDDSIVAAFILSLKLSIAEMKIDTWNNKTANSPKFCRPLILISKSETKSLIEKLYSCLQEEINKLQLIKVDNIVVTSFEASYAYASLASHLYNTKIYK